MADLVELQKAFHPSVWLAARRDPMYRATRASAKRAARNARRQVRRQRKLERQQYGRLGAMAYRNAKGVSEGGADAVKEVSGSVRYAGDSVNRAVDRVPAMTRHAAAGLAAGTAVGVGGGLTLGEWGRREVDRRYSQKVKKEAGMASLVELQEYAWGDQPVEKFFNPVPAAKTFFSGVKNSLSTGYKAGQAGQGYARYGARAKKAGQFKDPLTQRVGQHFGRNQNRYLAGAGGGLAATGVYGASRLGNGY